MSGSSRLRQLAPYGVAAALALGLAACSFRGYPDTTFNPHSEYGRAIDFLWNRLLFFGTLVFVLVEGALIFVVWRYRRRSDDVLPPQTHGNTVLEITWTLIPAAILAFIAVPTVRTIFQTQAPAPAGALEIQVYGHQWWWEFRYPQYNVVTANEIYLPKGRTVDFTLQTRDVLHSFWMPQLAGKRDLIANHTNHLWFTPDRTMPTTVWNGFCTEYCGAEHAEMHFRVVTVDPAQFAGWVRHQQAGAAFNPAPAPAAGAAVPAASQVAGAATTGTGTATGGTTMAPVSATTQMPPAGTTAGAPAVAQASMLPGTGGTPATPADYVFPRTQVPAYAIPHTPLPSIAFDDRLRGDAARGAALFVGAGTCAGCHTINGNPIAQGQVGPNLTHVGSRIGIAAMMYRNDAPHLARWIKNARIMKPGVLMPTLGHGQYDPELKTTIQAGLTDQQIADLVAYLQALK